MKPWATQNQRMVSQRGAGTIAEGGRRTASPGRRGHPYGRLNRASFPFVMMPSAEGIACLRREVHAAQEVLEGRVGAHGGSDRHFSLPTKLLINIASLVLVCRARASCLPSGDQFREKIRPVSKFVNCFARPPASG